MKRSPMPPRAGWMKRTTRLRTKNPDRRRREFARCYGSPERVAFVQARPCVVPRCGASPCENAHVGTGGAGRKADADRVVPLCPAHHRELHRRGARTFAVAHDLDLQLHAARADALWARWRDRRGLCASCLASYHAPGAYLCADCSYDGTSDFPAGPTFTEG